MTFKGLLIFVLIVLLVWYLRKPDVHRERPRKRRGPTPHEVLGVSPGASDADIRTAYQSLIRQYHPDKVATMGPEVREVAERRTRELNAAYAALKRGT